MDNQLVTQSAGGMLAHIDNARQALQQARTDLERLEVRDGAERLKVLAQVLDRREVEVEASILINDAERAIAKANPATPPEVSGAMKGKGINAESIPLSTSTLSQIRTTHRNLSDSDYQDALTRARRSGRALSRSRLREIGNRSQTGKAQEKKFELPRVESITLHHCGINDLWAHIEPESVQAIITDPPYQKIDIPVWRDLGEFARHALRPGGHLIALSGNIYDHECWHILNETTGFDRRIGPLYDFSDTPETAFQFAQWGINSMAWYKPFLWFARPPKEIYRKQTLPYLLKSPANDKAHHKWGQALDVFQTLVERLSDRDGLVCDPFLGGGTTALACMRFGVRFVGCDIEKSCILETRRRIAQELN